jgi:hypothetical protein
MKIRVKGRPDYTSVFGHRAPDVHAEIAGDEGHWAAGKSLYEALGNLIFHHREAFGIEIEVDGKSLRDAMDRIEGRW